MDNLRRKNKGLNGVLFFAFVVNIFHIGLPRFEFKHDVFKVSDTGNFDDDPFTL